MASVLDLIKHYQHAIEKYSKDEERVLRCIDKLYNLKVTTQHLSTVNALRKEPGDVGKAARSLVYKWKMMVASEESDQEEDHKTDSSKHNGHGSGKESDDNAQVKVKQEQHQHNSSSKTSHRDDKDMNGHHSGNKRRYHSSEEEEPDSKKTRKYSSSEDDKKKVVIKKERLSDSESNDEDSDSSESDSDSDSSESSGDRVQVKNEIKQEVVVKQEKTESPERHKQSKHSHRDHNSSSRDHSDHQRESSSSKRSHNSEKQSSSHYSSKSKDSNHTKHNSESKSSSNKHKSSHEKHIDEKKHSSEEKKYNSEDKKHSSDEKKHKSDHKSEDKKESKSSSSKHSADKHKSSSNKHETSTDKHKSTTEKHSSKEKHKSSLPLERDDKHRSLEKESKSKSKENSVNYSSSSSSKEKHSSSSKDKSRDSSSKEKSSSDKKHSSSESKSVSKSKHDRSDEKSTEKKSKDSSRSSHKSKSSSSSKEDVPKKKSKKSTEDIDGGIDCGSGASFAEALGMVSPAKPKKKSFRDLSPSVNDLSPAALLAPTAKLAPLPSLEITALPEISANYKPRPPPKLLPHFSDEDAISAGISSKNQRTKVYSGNKVIGKVTSLYEMCVHILQEHIDALEYTGGVPYEILKPVVDRATPQQLFLLEHYNPYLMEDTDHLWQKFCEKNFRNKKRQEMETWREMYMRCQEEQECKLKSLTANIRIAQEAKKAPIKQTKMAYVDSVVKPPRNIARKQAVHGTAFAAAGSPASRVAALSSSANVLRGGARPPPVAISTSSSFKPKKAPLMAKALQFMRGRKR